MRQKGAVRENLAPWIEKVLVLIEQEVERRFGRFGATAFHGRCVLVSHIAAKVIQHFHAPSSVITGTLQVLPGESIPGLDVCVHAWVRIGKRKLFDPTIVQAERERFQTRLANVGPALLVDIPASVDIRHEAINLRHPNGPELVYSPFNRRQHAAVCAQPDGDPARWLDMAQRVIRGIEHALPSANNPAQLFTEPTNDELATSSAIGARR